MSRRDQIARPGYYILFAVHAYIDAYYLGGNSISTVVSSLGVDDDHYAIAWCPSRNQAQKSAVKNYS